MNSIPKICRKKFGKKKIFLASNSKSLVSSLSKEIKPTLKIMESLASSPESIHFILLFLYKSLKCPNTSSKS